MPVSEFVGPVFESTDLSSTSWARCRVTRLSRNLHDAGRGPILFLQLVLVAGAAVNVATLAHHGPQGVQLALAGAAVEAVLKYTGWNSTNFCPYTVVDCFEDQISSGKVLDKNNWMKLGANKPPAIQ